MQSWRALASARPLQASLASSAPPAPLEDATDRRTGQGARCRGCRWRRGIRGCGTRGLGGGKGGGGDQCRHGEKMQLHGGPFQRGRRCPAERKGRTELLRRIARSNRPAGRWSRAISAAECDGAADGTLVRSARQRPKAERTWLAADARMDEATRRGRRADPVDRPGASPRQSAVKGLRAGRVGRRV